MTATRKLRPIPDWADSYATDGQDIFTLPHFVTRSNGRAYFVRGRQRRWSRDRGGEFVILCQRGRRAKVWRHKLMREFGEDA